MVYETWKEKPRLENALGNIMDREYSVFDQAYDWVNSTLLVHTL
jgi:hypothetical protein